MDEPNSTGLALFLSADLAGSTAFKQAKKPEAWQKFFRNFYRQLPAYVADHISTAHAKPLRMWKTVGDEIVIHADLQKVRHVPAILSAFRKAVAAYRKEIREWPGDIDIKCAGWTAGFPVGNLRVVLPDHGQMDYIGPGMDTGFRLVKEASPRRMLISVELAYLLTVPKVQGSPHIFMDAGLDLKGVARGRCYPFLWLDNFADDRASGGHKELALVEEHLRGARPPALPTRSPARVLSQMAS